MWYVGGMTKHHLDLIGSLCEYGVDHDTATQAAHNILDQKNILLLVSGKMGSGKDTVAPGVVAAVNSAPSISLSFAKALKNELTEVVTIIQDALASPTGSATTESVTYTIAQKMNVPIPQAQFIAETLFDAVKSGAVTDGFQRTPQTRAAQQFWGTQVRRAQDENYWVKITVREAAKSIAAGCNVYSTDARFVNEVQAVSSMGGFVVRLDVSEEEQARRIFARDNIVLSEEARAHVSETALDDYAGFNARIDTSRLSPAEVTAEILNQMGVHA